MMHKMIRSLTLGAATLMIAAVLAPTPADARGGRGRRGRAPRQGNTTQTLETAFDALESVPLTETEVEEVTFLREEEKLARDVYRTLGNTWNLRIFQNIAKAEQTHMDHTALLFEAYDLEDPVTDDAVGAFTNSVLDALYDDLVEAGSVSQVAALLVGAQIEDLDINDLDELLALTSNDQVRLVAQNLLKGSRNHMRAFVRNLTIQGATYTPQYISADELETILAGSQERGLVDENGDALAAGTPQGTACGGKGNGNGNGQQRRKRQRQGKGQGDGDGECDGTGSGSGNGGKGRQRRRRGSGTGN